MNIFFMFFGSRYLIALFTSSIETDVKENVFAKQLFLDFITFMLRWFLYLSIIPEIVFSLLRERVYVEKL